MMLIALFVTVSLAPQTPPVRVERSRGTVANAGAGVSTTLNTNGSGSGQTPIDAERAFAADAKTIGQWTAFRKWSTDDAVMFVPQPVNAHEFLKDRKDPPKVIDWWPTASYVSCDGKLAVNTGGWKRPDGSVGYFTTVWQRQNDGGWKWIVDSGDDLKIARDRPTQPVVKKASCGGPIPSPFFPIDPSERFNSGGSPDNSLLWSWSIAGPNDERTLGVIMCTGDCRSGRAFVEVTLDKIAPPK